MRGPWSCPKSPQSAWRFLGVALASMTLLPGCASHLMACERSHTPKHDLPERGISAHRGGLLGCPVNTLVAFQRAICRGVHQIELDVRATADEALVVAHADQVTNEDGQTLYISKSTFAEVRNLKLEPCSGEEAWQSIPTLDEALAVMPQNIWINVDIKNNDPRVAKLVAETVAKTRRFDQVIFAARDKAAPAIRQVAEKAGQKSLIGNMNRELFRFQSVDTTIASCDEFIQLTAMPYLPFLRGKPNQDTMDRLKKAGVRVNYSWLGEEDEGELKQKLEDLFDRGVDFVLVDYVEQAMKAADTLGISPLVPHWNRTSLQTDEPLFHCPSTQ
jgi:glycerophosphoryl diester phosphodiesterase